MQNSRLDILARLGGHEVLLRSLLEDAERLHLSDRGAAASKLRTVGELMCRDLAPRLGLDLAHFAGQAELLDGMRRARPNAASVIGGLHRVRIAGNAAIHEGRQPTAEELERLLEATYQAAVWYLDERGAPAVDRSGSGSGQAPAEAAPRALERSPASPPQFRTEAPDELLARLHAEGKQLVEALGHSAVDLDSAAERASRSIEDARQPFRLGVVGEFRAGKSTLVNALAGQSLALVGEVETTHTISRYGWGPEARATFHYLDGRRETTSIEAANVTLRCRQGDPDWAANLDHVYFETPADGLRGLELWDAPGLGGSDSNEDLANRFIGMVGGALWVFDATLLGDQGLVAPLVKLAESGKRVVGLINRCDELDDDQRAEAITFVADTYGGLLTRVEAISALEMSEGDDAALRALRATIQAELLQHAQSDRQRRVDAAFAQAFASVGTVLGHAYNTTRDMVGLVGHIRENLENAMQRTLAALPSIIEQALSDILEGHERAGREALRGLFTQQGNRPSIRSVDRLLRQLEDEIDLAAEWRRLVLATTDGLADVWSRFSQDALELTRASVPQARFRPQRAAPKTMQSEVSEEAAYDAAEAAFEWGALSAATLGVVAAASSVVAWPVILASVPIGLLAGGHTLRQTRILQVPSLDHAISLHRKSLAELRETLERNAERELPSNIEVTLSGQVERIILDAMVELLGHEDMQAYGRLLADLRLLIQGAFEQASARSEPGAEFHDPTALSDLQVPSGAGARSVLARMLSGCRGRLDVLSPSVECGIERLLVHVPAGTRLRWVTTSGRDQLKASKRAAREAVERWPGSARIRVTTTEAGARAEISEMVIIAGNRAWCCAERALLTLDQSAFTLRRYPLGVRAAERRFGEVWTGRSTAGPLIVEEA